MHESVHWPLSFRGFVSVAAKSVSRNARILELQQPAEEQNCSASVPSQQRSEEEVGEPWALSMARTSVSCLTNLPSLADEPFR